MTKKTKNPKRPDEKLGRPQSINSQDLLSRYRLLKQFIESNFGRIWLELRKVHNPDEIRKVLKGVTGIESCTPFRDHPAKCLIADGTGEIQRHEVNLTRKQWKAARDKERLLSMEFQDALQQASAASVAWDAAFNQFAPLFHVDPWGVVLLLLLIARKLNVRGLTINSDLLNTSFQQTHRKQQDLAAQLLAEEGRLARKEIEKFMRDSRYEKTAINFAKVMAGLPELGWLHSLRRCSDLQDESLSDTNLNHQLLELLMKIVKAMKRVSAQKLENKLRDELLNENAWMLRSYIEPNWPWMKQAIAECRGKGYERAELPYKIMSAFLRNVERPKTPFEIELAKREQLVSN